MLSRTAFKESKNSGVLEGAWEGFGEEVGLENSFRIDYWWRRP